MPHTRTPELIYVVEDEPAIARLIADTLAKFGYRTELFATAEAFFHGLRQRVPELVILDLGLPDMDGVTLIKQMAALRSCGVLVLTARGHPFDRIMGLEMGCDDYVVKPFDPRELVARVRSILRRSNPAGGQQLPQARRYAGFLGWTLDCAANTLASPEGTEHLLSTAETQVLREFVERPHQILTREQLLGQRDLSPLDRSIDVRISRIRRKIEADPQNPKIIKTVYGAGYMFTAHVTWS